MSGTVLDQIETSLRVALEYNPNAETPPVALLWPDRERQFEAAVELLPSRLPLLTLGSLDASRGRGPAYWVRCAIARTVETQLPEDAPPVVYLPGVGREDLRAIEDCPRHLAPIAELQYRGQWFAHPNGKDWTVRSFLSNKEHGLGLDLAQNGATGEALRGAFAQLLPLPMRRLAAEHIDADFLHRLLNPDPAGRLLEWLDDPSGFRARQEPAEWKAFVDVCKREFSFDPASDGELTGGRLLGERKGQWKEVWRRFEENPERYAGVEARLRDGKPQELFPGNEGSWPQDNEAGEKALRSALSELAGAPAATARKAIGSLWEQHRERQGWVWARLERAPLAFALEQLYRLVEHTTAGPSESLDELVKSYAESGWQADDALLAALQAAPEPADRKAVAGAAVALYWSWLDVHARALQDAIGPLANSGTHAADGEAATDDGTITVFVDGLRLDLGHRLAHRLGDLEVNVKTALAALPTVTETAKPVVTPVPEGSLAAGSDLAPVRAGSGARAGIQVLRSLMEERGVQVLKGAETGDPSGCAWTEAADIDRRGHDFGITLVDDVDRELDQVAKRVKLLLDAGWEEVDVVTDHGWLLLPDGLEKVDLPAATVEVKKGRCARLKPGAAVSVPTVPWHWDRNVQIALAPGASCFEANQEYEHGGVSLQECVVPRLRIRTGDVTTTTGGAAITRIKWLGLLCRIEFENVASGATVDIRALPGDASTSVAEAAKETTSAGKLSLIVPDETHEEEAAYVVIASDDGRILAQRSVTIGVNR